MTASTASVPDPRTGLPIGPEVASHAARRPERTTLAGRYVTLAPLDPERHAAELFAETHGEGEGAMWQYLGDGPFADLSAFTASLRAKAASADPLFFAILDAASGRALGYQTLMRIDAPNRVVEVGNIVYGRSLQRTPGATEAQYLFARHVFDDLGYRRYEWKCNACNAPSQRAARRFGFSYEGLFRQHMIVKGRNRDTAWFSMLDHEWPARRAAFEAWLNPDNFDADGRQRRSLSDFAGAPLT
ncbi:GNAT family N-acetyltransferase [Alsobacter sp. SYSU M60028]|uniref:GNAT family N-acetyltransferase n=1 Tax=Alsobacter ponti TaxID=2962936 RepID=A0ABT1LDJ7_9HYPH|nr:GNAT family protein [Alsobacter ponti]MCP8939587.1 GNAT family N-acetyltransferase [Alsobacter ponti]